MGEVLESASERFVAGEQVLLTGWGIGERQWGGFAQLARVPASTLLHVPEDVGEDAALRCMILGTAGLTAALSVSALERRGVRGTAKLPVVVTGAAGGVGSVAVALLAARGHHVVASTGRAALADYLGELGAAEVIGREFSVPPKGPLAKQRWAGGVDPVGGQTLATLLSEIHYGGAVACCGLAGGARAAHAPRPTPHAHAPRPRPTTTTTTTPMRAVPFAGHDLPATVMPFILRGVALEGIDSVMCPTSIRREAWSMALDALSPERLGRLHTATIALADLPQYGAEILKGQIQGRVVVEV